MKELFTGVSGAFITLRGQEQRGEWSCVQREAWEVGRKETDNRIVLKRGEDTWKAQGGCWWLITLKW